MEASGSWDNRSSKSLKLQEKEDRISALPDSLIHHILSFLPSTKGSIRTGVLSKRWRNQWTQVPVLVFKCRNYDEDYARFTDNTLLAYGCLKMKKFHVAYDFKGDSNFISKLRSVTRRDVEELILNSYRPDDLFDPYLLPNFIFDNASLVKLHILNCDFQLTRINWPSLKVLKLDFFYSLEEKSGSIQNVLSGSPLLESFEISSLDLVNPITIASKSLKKLIFVDIEIKHHLEISCPNLEELCVKVENLKCLSTFPSETLQNVLSGCPSLHSLELMDCYFQQLVIKSKFLKRLVLGPIRQDNGIEISCPNLEELNWYDSAYKVRKLMNLDSSVCATLFRGSEIKVPSKILEELQKVKELKIQDWCLKILSALKMQEVSYPLLNVKSLTLDCPNFEYVSGIVNAIRCSPALESLVIKLHAYEMRKIADVDWTSLEETNEPPFTCLVTHLNTIEILGLSERDYRIKVILCFVKFLLKNARPLEKMVVKLKNGGVDFEVKVARKLLSFPRCSEHSIIELS